jgi:hypothetical protein
MVITPKNTRLWYDNYQTLHMTHKFIPIIWNHNVQWILQIFQRLQIISIIFWVYLHFFIALWCTFFCHKYIFEPHNTSWNLFYFLFEFFELWFTILCKKIAKNVILLPWLRFKHGHPWKTIQCGNILGPPVIYFHPHIVANILTCVQETFAVNQTSHGLWVHCLY